MSAPVLAVDNLSAWYGAARILFDVSFHVGRGEVVALMGRNGAGKSTTMKALMGLVARRSGKVQFLQHDVSGLKPYQVARMGVGWVPEDRRIFTDLTVMENLDVGRHPPRSWPPGQPDAGQAAPAWTPEKLFRLFPNLAEMRSRPGGRMSGGEQQMLTVARTLMGNPFLVLLDEPSEGVAPLIVERMAATIVELKKQGLCILLSEQNLRFAGMVSDRVYLLEKGRIAWNGPMASLAADTEIQRELLTL
jgi:branched-chain amino acid transport system ATP-binding protein